MVSFVCIFDNVSFHRCRIDYSCNYVNQEELKKARLAHLCKCNGYPKRDPNSAVGLFSLKHSRGYFTIRCFQSFMVKYDQMKKKSIGR